MDITVSLNQLEKMRTIIQEKEYSTDTALKEIDKLLKTIMAGYDSYIGILAKNLRERDAWVKEKEALIKELNDLKNKLLQTVTGNPAKEEETAVMQKRIKEIESTLKIGLNRNIQNVIDTVMDEMNKMLDILRKYFRPAADEIGVAIKKNKSQKFWFWLLQAFLYFITLLISYYISEYAEEEYSYKGLWSQVVISLVLLITVERIFTFIKKKIFWWQANRLYNKIQATFTTIHSLNTNFTNLDPDLVFAGEQN